MGKPAFKRTWSRILLATCIGLTAFLALSAGCGGGDGGDSDEPGGGAVAITDMGSYYKVEIDYTGGNHYAIGREYGQKVLYAAPDFEEKADSYLRDLVAYTDPLSIVRADRSVSYAMMLDRALEIKNQIDAQYVDELEGFASVLSGGDLDELGDGKLSENELLILNLVPDIVTDTACSGLAVYGDRSATGQTLVGRVTDWFSGNTGQMGYLNAVVHSTHSSGEFVSIGWLGMLGVLVGINSDGVFLANLYSALGTEYSADGRNSILFDIRYSLEHSSSLTNAAAYLSDSERLYAYNHNIFLADETTAAVLENDFLANRALRTADSALNTGVEWGFSNAVACVNSFILQGNDDNHTAVDENTERWANYKARLTAAGSTMGFTEMKNTVTYHRAGSFGTEQGDIYNVLTVQAVVYSYSDNRLELWLKPDTALFTDQPSLKTVDMPFAP